MTCPSSAPLHRLCKRYVPEVGTVISNLQAGFQATLRGSQLEIAVAVSACGESNRRQSLSLDTFRRLINGSESLDSLTPLGFIVLRWLAASRADYCNDARTHRLEQFVPCVDDRR